MRISFWNTKKLEVTIPGLHSFQLPRSLNGDIFLDGLDDNLIPLPEKFKKLVIDKILVPNTIIANSGSIEIPDTDETYEAISEFYTLYLGDRVEVEVIKLQVVEEQLAYSGLLSINNQMFQYEARCRFPMRSWKLSAGIFARFFARFFEEQKITYTLRQLNPPNVLHLTPEIIMVLDTTVGSSIYLLEESMLSRVWAKPHEYMNIHSWGRSWLKSTVEAKKALTTLGVPRKDWFRYQSLVYSKT